MAGGLTPPLPDDDTTMDEWLRQRNQQLDGDPSFGDGDPGDAGFGAPVPGQPTPFSTPDVDAGPWAAMVAQNQALQARNDPLAFDASGGEPFLGAAAGQPRPAAVADGPAPGGVGAAGSVSGRGARRYQTGPILDLISQGEGTTGPDGYDKVFGQGWKKGFQYPQGAKPPSQLTLDEWIALGPQLRRANGSSAMGKYQMMTKTLAGEPGRPGLKRQLGLTGREIMTPDLQDQLAEANLYRHRGLYDFLSRKISPEAFQQQLAQEWRSLAFGPGDYIYSPNGARTPARIKTDKIQAALQQTLHADKQLNDQIDAGRLPPP